MILADQLTLFQPEGADYAHQITTGPLDFQTFLQPCGDAYVFQKDKIVSLITASTLNLSNELSRTSSDLSLIVTQQFN